MTITLGSTTLCAGQTRNSSGNPVGPNNLRMQLSPGVAVREYVGADRVEPEHVRCDSGSVTFGVTRTYADMATALAYLAGDFLSEAKEGQLKFDNTNIFGEGHNSVVVQRTAALVGCTVAINYSITG